jgi:hypothetical protein
MDKDLEIGLKIDKELESLFQSGKYEYTVEELESSAPEAYEVLYDCCEEEDEQNGLETSNYKLIEDPKTFKFKLSKK